MPGASSRLSTMSPCPSSGCSALTIGSAPLMGTTFALVPGAMVGLTRLFTRWRRRTYVYCLLQSTISTA
eukprot:scaffold28957_cov112-Isochrysis_galbana.AAC.2